MAGEHKSQGGKEEIKKGMDEAGKHPTGGAGAKPGKDKGSDKVTQGMTESGSGRPTGGESSGSKTR